MKMKAAIILLLLSLLMTACGTVHAPVASSPISPANLGKKVTVEGYAVNRKFGAELVGEGFSVFIEGLAGWPEEICAGGERGRKLRVTGLLAEDYGLPVFIPKPNEPLVQGIPVPEGTDLQKARHRFLLKNATWETPADKDR